MSRLSEISASPTLREFAQGAAQSAIMPVADFLAPTVEVATSTGRFKSYTEKNRFHIPDTLRTLGGRAAELRFEATDATFNCEPHALDYPVDNLEQLEAEGLENMLREGATAVAEVAALAHEKTVIDAALAAVGAGTGKTWNASADPIADVDDAILAVIKAAKYGSLMGVGVLFGATAWKIFKNQEKVRGRFVVGNGRRQGRPGAGGADGAVGEPDVHRDAGRADVLHDLRRGAGGEGGEHQLPAGHGGADLRAQGCAEPARSELHEDVPADEQVHGAGVVHARRRARGGGEVRLVART